MHPLAIDYFVDQIPKLSLSFNAVFEDDQFASAFSASSSLASRLFCIHDTCRADGRGAQQSTVGIQLQCLPFAFIIHVFVVLIGEAQVSFRAAIVGW